MKNKIFIIALAILMFTAINVDKVYSQDLNPPRERTISTQGQSRIWIIPDKARVFLGIETLDQSISGARDINAMKIKKVINALESLRIKGMLMKAPSYSVSIEKEDQYQAKKQKRLPEIIGYKVKQDFTVLLSDKDPTALAKNAAKIIDTALESGVNIIQQITFFKEDESKDKQKAISLAVENAIANAETIAKSAKVEITKYNTINTSTGYYQQPRMMQNMQFSEVMSDARATPTTLAAGKIAIDANVTLSCSIE